MRILWCALVIFCSFSSLCFSGEFKRYDAILAELSQKTAQFSESPKIVKVDEKTIRRDPLHALVDAQGNVLEPSRAKESALVLQGIVGSAGSMSALINDKFYTQGETVDQYRILEIRANGVVIQNGDEKSFIDLYPGSSK